jgi:hypothetical protein
VSTKDTNPKDIVGDTKLPLNCVPATLEIYASLAFVEGALKYGRFNWRIAGVRSSIYMSALRRHLDKYDNGEWADPDTEVPHLASVLACAGIILDAFTCGKLTDDRPPTAPIAELIDSLVPAVAHLKERFKDCHPYQYTIKDSEHGHTRVVGRVLQKVPLVTKSQEGSGSEKPRKTRLAPPAESAPCLPGTSRHS